MFPPSLGILWGSLRGLPTQRMSLVHRNSHSHLFTDLFQVCQPELIHTTSTAKEAFAIGEQQQYVFGVLILSKSLWSIWVSLHWVQWTGDQVLGKGTSRLCCIEQQECHMAVMQEMNKWAASWGNNLQCAWGFLPLFPLRRLQFPWIYLTFEMIQHTFLPSTNWLQTVCSSTQCTLVKIRHDHSHKSHGLFIVVAWLEELNLWN